MATIKKSEFRLRQFGGLMPGGNLTVLPFQAVTNAAGGVVGADVETPVQAGDVIDLGPLPPGMRLDDATTRVSAGWTAAVTGSLGFRYEDGVDDPRAPQDAAYFGAGITLHTAGTYRMASAKAVVVLRKDARLILTTAGAANAKASRTDIAVIGELTGAP